METKDKHLTLTIDQRNLLCGGIRGEILAYNTSFLADPSGHRCSASRTEYFERAFSPHWTSFLRSDDDAVGPNYHVTEGVKADAGQLLKDIGADDVLIMPGAEKQALAKGKCFIAFTHSKLEGQSDFLWDQIVAITEADSQKKTNPFVLIVIDSAVWAPELVKNYEKDILAVVSFVVQNTKDARPGKIDPSSPVLVEQTSENLRPDNISPKLDQGPSRFWGSVKQSFSWSGWINVANFVGLGAFIFSIGIFLKGAALVAAAPFLVATTMGCGVLALAGLLLYAPWKMYEHYRQWDYKAWRTINKGADTSYARYRSSQPTSLFSYRDYLKLLIPQLFSWVIKNKVQAVTMLIGLISATLMIVVGTGLLPDSFLASWLSDLVTSITQLLSNGFDGLGLSFLSSEVVLPYLASIVTTVFAALVPLIIVDNIARLMRVYDDAVEAEKGDYCVRTDEADVFAVTAKEEFCKYNPEEIHSATQAWKLLWGKNEESVEEPPYKKPITERTL